MGSTPLARLLKRHGLKQLELAYEAKTTVSTVAGLVAGRRLPNGDTAIKILAALQKYEPVTFEDLWGVVARGREVA